MEVSRCKRILGEDKCKTNTSKLDSMFDGNAIPVDVKKQQRVVEKLRDDLETELRIFFRSGYVMLI